MTTNTPAENNIILTRENGLRFQKLGNFGEQLAFTILTKNGFSKVINLNTIISNFPFADFYAERNNKMYIISVKSRNKFEHKGNLNSRYKLGKFEPKLQKIKTQEKYSEYKECIPAWLTVSFEEKTFDAYFGTIEMLNGNRAILMSKKHLPNYETLSLNENHGFNSDDFMNIYNKTKY